MSDQPLTETVSIGGHLRRVHTSGKGVVFIDDCELNAFIEHNMLLGRDWAVRDARALYGKGEVGEGTPFAAHRARARQRMDGSRI